MIRVAAVGDVHVGEESTGRLREHFARLHHDADLLVLAGDLTRVGAPAEAAVLAGELVDTAVPVVAVLGNHDLHSDEGAEVRKVLEDAGVTVLEGESTVVDLGEARVGVAGVKGFGGGFAGASASEFGEQEMKAFVVHSRERAFALERELDRLADARVDARIALTHYSPVPDTLAGERLEIYPFLGSYLLAEAIDRAGADLAIHGHAHAGTEKGVTPGGVHVRNVAQPVIRHAYNLYCLQGDDGLACPAGDAVAARA